MTKDEYFDQLDVPHHIRREQRAWERRHTFLRLYHSGVRLKELVEINRRMGFEARTRATISYLCKRAWRERQEPWFKHGSPVERWIARATTARVLHAELQQVGKPERKKPPPRTPEQRRKERERAERNREERQRREREWMETFSTKRVELKLSVPSPPGWNIRYGELLHRPRGETTFRAMWATPNGDYYCDLIIDRPWDGDTRSLFAQTINEIARRFIPVTNTRQAASGNA